jgi:hypothetical protein
VIDIALDFYGQLKDFVRSQVSPKGIACAPLLNLHKLTGQDTPQVPPEMGVAMQYLLHFNPIVQTYKTIWELSEGVVSNPYLSLDSIKQFVVGLRNARIETSLGKQGESTQLYAVIDANPRPQKRAKISPHFDGLCVRGSNIVDRFVSTASGVVHGLNYARCTLETCLFPYIHPNGVGGWDGFSPFKKYMRWTVNKLFSPYTLCKTYMPVMFQMFQAVQIDDNTVASIFEAEYRKLSRKYPNLSDEDIMKKVLKHKSLKAIPGTSAYFRNKRRQLLDMVDKCGMPTYFITLTAADIPGFHWQEYSDMLKILRTWDEDVKLNDVPVECAKVFVERVQLFMKHVLAPKNASGIMGNVTDYCIRYESQMRGSLHAHILIWVHPDDEPRVSKEITGCMPGVWREDLQKFVPLSADPMHTHLLYLAEKLQSHSCSKDSCRKDCHGHKCYYGFPCSAQSSVEPVMDDVVRKWMYYRPRHEDRNVVPYHPLVLLFWEAHCNVQKVTKEDWSEYLMKYATKGEAVGNLNLDVEKSKVVGLSSFSTAQLKAYTALFQSTPVSPCETTLHMMGVDLVELSQTFEYVDTSTPEKRMRRFPKAQHTKPHPVQMYVRRPEKLQHITFRAYHEWYTVRDQPYVRRSCYAEECGQDNDGRYVYKLPTKKNAVFTKYHPANEIEAYFFNVLLDKVPFIGSEMNIFSQFNSVQSYVVEAFIRGVVDIGDLPNMVTCYCNYYMRRTYDQACILNVMHEHIVEVMNKSRDKCPDIVRQVLSHTDIQDTAQYVPQCNAPQEADRIPLHMLNLEQKAVYDAVTTKTGLHIISGPPGSGKTFLVTAIAQHYEQDKAVQVAYSATTGAAAICLHRNATTAHRLFGLPLRGCTFRPHGPRNVHYKQISHCKVFVIDEFSMMTGRMFNNVISQLMHVHRCHTFAELCNTITIILVGDRHQLPPVCHCKRQPMTVCGKCSIANSLSWSKGLVHELQISMRHATDPTFARFLSCIRTFALPQPLIDAVLQQCYIPTKESALQICDGNTTVLCTHREDCQFFNSHMLQRLFSATDILQIPLWYSESCNDVNVPERVQQFLNSNNNNIANCLAKGSKVMLIANGNLQRGAANGAIGIVKDFIYKQDFLHSIAVELCSTKETIMVTRTYTRTMTDNKTQYVVKGFPLQLAYSYTGHKSQGATLSGNTILYVRQGFEMGLVYVMLSRVTNRENLKIVGGIAAEDCLPMSGLSNVGHDMCD